jgi:hypothetical protein
MIMIMDGMICKFQRGDGMTGGNHVHVKVAEGCPVKCSYGNMLKINDFGKAISAEGVWRKDHGEMEMKVEWVAHQRTSNRHDAKVSNYLLPILKHSQGWILSRLLKCTEVKIAVGVVVVVGYVTVLEVRWLRDWQLNESSSAVIKDSHCRQAKTAGPYYQGASYVVSGRCLQI